MKIGPYFILALGGGPATAVGLGFVSFPTDEDLSVGAPSGPIFTRVGSPARGLCALGQNAIHLSSVNRP